MQKVTLEHFIRATEDIGFHGDNDMLPFDIDNRFLSDKKNQLAKVAFKFLVLLIKAALIMRRTE